jgi:site-specific DNA-methyltransferase (adenine-specific)
MPVIEGDCLEIMHLMAQEGIQYHAVITDPPYGLNFMNRYWDGEDNIAFHVDTWKRCLDLLLPGGHLIAFSSTRTYHRLVCAIEDAGFEIRDQLAWVYGSGLPKALDVSKAIATAEADYWFGWKTCLKPAWEPIVLARKPFKGSVAKNVLAHGTGALNIEATRVPIDAAIDDPRLGGKGTWGTGKMAKNVYEGGYEGIRVGSSPAGRYPANIVHDGSEEVLELFESYGEHGGGDRRGECRGRRPGGFGDVGHDKGDQEPNATVYADSGSAARFFQTCRPSDNEARFIYCAKASKKERRGSKHPTIKPVALMRWLVRLVTPPGGLILDPFGGTGTTGEAAALEGFDCVLIERDPEYVRDIEHRLSDYEKE